MTIRLSPTQKTIVSHGDGPLLVVAGPGSGKTRVLTERIRRLLRESQGHFRVLALTFTNKAANEMKERLQEFPKIEELTFIGTLHSFCLEVLANRGKAVGVEGTPIIFELRQDRKQVLVEAVSRDPDLSHILKLEGDAKKQNLLIDCWLNMIADAKNRLLLPEMLKDEICQQVYSVYQAGLQASKALDFDDLLLLTYQLFEERPKIADFYRRQYRYICIDEAQDVNEAQYQLIRALCGSEYRNIMMVGDPKQAIFVWNGADPKYLDLFEKDFGAQKISMHENFRSSKAIVTAAKRLAPEYSVEGDLPIMGTVELITGKDEDEEAVKVLDQINALISSGHKDIEGGVSLERCALLARTRYVFLAVENELKKRKWPYYKHLSSQHESESTPIQDFELCMKLAANPGDRLHLGMLLSRWKLPIDSITGSDILSFLNHLAEKTKVSHAKQIVSSLDKMNPSGEDVDFTPSLQALETYAKSLKDEQDRALILQDIKVWRNHWEFFLRSERGGDHSLNSFLTKVALGTTQQPRQEGLALLTVHSAKGLEFDIVFLMGMSQGTFPDYRAKGSALQEEKRLAFVAVTRSRRLLWLSYPRTKMMPWGDTREQKPSEYLKIIGLHEPTN